MQEHPQPLEFIIRTSARRKRIEQLDKPAKSFLLLILNLTLVFVAPPFAKGTYSQAHLYYVLDRKALNFFKCW
jgi:hypothetical protein